MEGSLDRVPDGVEPLVGYRAWTYALDGPSASLHPVGGHVDDDPDAPNPWAGAEAGWVVATCKDTNLDPDYLDEIEALAGCQIDRSRFHDPGDVPGEECTCGFYSAKTLLALLEMVGFSRDTPGKTAACMLGRVELSGKIVEHDFGYRAERARIAELIPFEADLAIGTHLATTLGVALGDPVRLRPYVPTSDPIPPPPEGPSTPRLRVGDWVAA